VLESNNTTLSSIAASILLRICSENYLEKLFTKIEKTMVEMSVDYKVDVVKSLIGVLQNYPAKYTAVNTFLVELLKK
jgi:coatomer protein complex subunit gamma